MSSTRREFLAQGGLAMAGTAVMSHATLNAAPVPGNIPLGFQAFEIVPDLNKDWEGTLKQMVAMGYKLIDMVAMNPYNTRSGKQLRAEFNARRPRLQRLPLRLRVVEHDASVRPWTTRTHSASGT